MTTINGITLEEAKAIAAKGDEVVVADGQVERIQNRKPKEKEKLPIYRREEVDAFLNGLEKEGRMYLLAHISWQERLESLAEKMQSEEDALEAIYLRSKAVQC